MNKLQWITAIVYTILCGVEVFIAVTLNWVFIILAVMIVIVGILLVKVFE